MSRCRDDAGMSLVEVIVAVTVASMFLGLLAILFVTSWTNQQRTAERDAATGGANVAIAIVSSIRNATDVRVAGTRLDASVIAADGTWDCRSWAVNAAARELLYVSTGPARLPDTLTGASPILKGVEGLLAGGAAFALDGAKGVQIGMSFTVGRETVTIRDGVAAQAISKGAQPCWP